MATTPKQKTTAKIRSTFIKMLSKNSVNDITVTDLCKAAGVNRATFYYHYNSVEDVAAEIERNMESEFARFLSLSTITEDGSPEKSFYVTFFEFVARNADMCRLIVNSPRTNITFLTKALAAGRTKAIADMTEVYPNCPTYKIEYYYLFVSHGFLGLLSHWLNSGMKETPEEIAAIGENVSRLGVKYLA